MLLLLPLLLLLPSSSSLSCRPCPPGTPPPSSCTSGEVVSGPCGCPACARAEREACSSSSFALCAQGLTCVDKEGKVADEGVCRASCQEGSTLGRDYTGNMATTSRGRTCQAWAAASPHGCGGQPCFPGLEGNHCRNPDNETGGVWCYTTEEDSRWEYCDVPKCSERPMCPQVECCGSDGTTYPTPCAAPPGVTCVDCPPEGQCQKMGQEWSSWSACSTSCEAIRVRVIVTGCGQDCRAERISERRICPSCCPLSPTPWTPWSSCPVACGGGVSRRSRDVVLERLGDCYRQRIEQEDVCNLLPCPVIEPCPIMCTSEIMAPVCGSDGKTYSNSCQLRAASCSSPSITLAHEGPCQTESCGAPECGLVCQEMEECTPTGAQCVVAPCCPAHACCPKFCTKIFKPVCGSDGNTYPNECVMKRTSCSSPTSITLDYEGQCKPEGCPESCEEIFKPVCGSDMVTYDNACFLRKAACEAPANCMVGLADRFCKEITLAHEGKCEEDRCDGGDSCCTAEARCGAGEGDCDHDSDCLEGHTCGKDNCGGESFDNDDDCCVAVKVEASWLDPHNEFRRKHIDTPDLVVDQELIKKAQDCVDGIAQTGAIQHCSSGENIYASHGIGGDLYQEAVSGWYEEGRGWRYGQGLGFSSGTGHFTQVVWKATTNLGCAMAKMKGWTYIVCNYSPPGNLQGTFDQNVLPLK